MTQKHILYIYFQWQIRICFLYLVGNHETNWWIKISSFYQFIALQVTNWRDVWGSFSRPVIGQFKSILSTKTRASLHLDLDKVLICLTLWKVGSYAYDETKMIFNASLLAYDDSLRNTILDYNVKLDPLKSVDSLFIWQSIGNYSLTGFEMTLKRNSLKYLVNYYLPSGLFVVVSWVSTGCPKKSKNRS